MTTFRRFWILLFALISLAQPAHVTLAQPGDLLDPLPPDYSQGRGPMLPGCEALPSSGAAYCGPTSSSDLLKWLNENGYPAVGAWGESCCEVREAIFGVGLRMDTDASGGTTTTNLREGLQAILDETYPDVFDVGYIGRVSRYSREREWGRDFRNLKLHLDDEHLVIGHIGWYDLQDPDFSGKRCGGHYVAVTGYDDVAGDLWVRLRDPARNVNCAVNDGGVCSPLDDGCVARWRTSLQEVDLERPEGSCVMDTVSASRWHWDRDAKLGDFCGSYCRERLPYQDGFAYIGGVRLFSQPATGSGMFISANLASGESGSHSAATGTVFTAVQRHPVEFKLYYCGPTSNHIYITDLHTNQVTTFTTGTGVQLNQPRRLVFGSDSTLYVLQGDPSAGFSILAIDSDGNLIGQAGPGSISDIAYHEKLERVYAWSGSSGVLQAYTPSLAPITPPITLPPDTTYADPGHLAIDPTGDILYYNHNGSSDIFRFDLSMQTQLASISDTELSDPADMALNNRGHLYVAQGTPAPVLEFDRDGSRVTTSAAYGFTANTNLTMTRASRAILLDPDETNPHNLNVDSLDPPDIPTVSEWGTVALFLLLLCAASIVVIRRRRLGPM